MYISVANGLPVIFLWAATILSVLPSGLLSLLFKSCDIFFWWHLLLENNKNKTTQIVKFFISSDVPALKNAAEGAETDGNPGEINGTQTLLQSRGLFCQTIQDFLPSDCWPVSICGSYSGVKMSAIIPSPIFFFFPTSDADGGRQPCAVGIFWLTQSMMALETDGRRIGLRQRRAADSKWQDAVENAHGWVGSKAELALN